MFLGHHGLDHSSYCNGFKDFIRLGVDNQHEAVCLDDMRKTGRRPEIFERSRLSVDLWL